MSNVSEYRMGRTTENIHKVAERILKLDVKFC